MFAAVALPPHRLNSAQTEHHEFVSFDDPTSRRTWVFDVTFFASNWTCVYGRGCKGVYPVDATAKFEGCCSHGAHLADGDDFLVLKQAAERLTPDQWQFAANARRHGYTKKLRDGTVTTRIVDGACIFQNRPGWHAGPGCALHQAALEAGERPLDWKPNVCWQLPIRVDEHTDMNGHMTSTVREWKRRDWGEGGEEFHWWCTEAPDAFVGAVPTYVGLEDELVETVGRAVYDMLAEYLADQPRRTWLPHPAVRRRR